LSTVLKDYLKVKQRFFTNLDEMTKKVVINYNGGGNAHVTYNYDRTAEPFDRYNDFFASIFKIYNLDWNQYSAKLKELFAANENDSTEVLDSLSDLTNEFPREVKYALAMINPKTVSEPNAYALSLIQLDADYQIDTTRSSWNAKVYGAHGTLRVKHKKSDCALNVKDQITLCHSWSLLLSAFPIDLNLKPNIHFSEGHTSVSGGDEAERQKAIQILLAKNSVNLPFTFEISENEEADNEEVFDEEEGFKSLSQNEGPVGEGPVGEGSILRKNRQ